VTVDSSSASTTKALFDLFRDLSMMMSTYGTMEGKEKEARRAIMVEGKITTTKFQYPEVIANHY
jgi:hypothetical protein